MSMVTLLSAQNVAFQRIPGHLLSSSTGRDYAAIVTPGSAVRQRGGMRQHGIAFEGRRGTSPSSVCGRAHIREEIPDAKRSGTVR